MSTKKVVLAVVGVVALIVCGFGGVLVYNGLDVGKTYFNSAVTPEEFEAQRIGEAEDRVRAALPESLDVDEKNLYGADATLQGRPVGADCVYHPVQPLTEAGEEPMFRFCFAGGELTEKKKIRVEG